MSGAHEPNKESRVHKIKGVKSGELKWMKG